MSTIEFHKSNLFFMKSRKKTVWICQLCGSRDSQFEILDLGHQPICNAVLAPDALDEPEIYYPLRLVVCKNCYLVQLANVIPASTVFNADYNYLSGTTKSLVRYFRLLSGKIVERFSVNKGETICDIGSNDGTFLRFFKEKGMNVIGIEPTPLPAKMAKDKGIPTIQEFFDQKTGEKVFRDLGEMKVVTAMNVLAHTDNVHSFLEGVKTLIGQESFFISQSHYLPLLMERLEFDTIYHEHLRYYTFTTLKKLLEMHGLHIFDAEINEIYGGSILIYSSIKDIEPSKNVRELLSSEAEYQKIETYVEFAKRVKANVRNLVRLLLDLKEKGNRIAGIGAPMKATTFLNYSHIGPDIIDYLTEVNPLKIGKFSPGVHIPIVDENVLFDFQPEYVLIFSWNIASEIVTSLRNKGYAGKFIIPIPEPCIIDKTIYEPIK